MSIILKSLSYIHSDGTTLFQNINISISDGDKVSLVGDNGSGKSTLLRIIAGKQNSTSGDIDISSSSYYVPQYLGQYDDYTVSQILDVENKLTALRAILNGSNSLSDFESLNDDWEIEERIQSAFEFWNIQNIDLYQQMNSLSGGEKTKILLAGIQIHSPEIILLDEPSNHLDSESRKILYRFIKSSRSTILVVSHDIMLLNMLKQTFVLKRNTIEAYGGNYDFYKLQNEQKIHALQTQLSNAEKALKKARQKACEIAEQRQKSEIKSKKAGQKGGTPRIVANTLKSKAEQSTAKLKSIHSEKLNELSDNLRQLRIQVQNEQTLKINLKETDLHNGKILFEAKKLNFSFTTKKPLWESPLTFQIRSGDRVRIDGYNGSGKSTLIKIITGKLSPSSGNLYSASFKYLYIDQEYSMVDFHISIFEQVQKFNERLLQEHELKTILHRYQFSSDTWNRPCSQLSGGEKMKLILCCLNICNNTPDMLILDEPTNNLDIHSLEMLLSSLKEFNGSLLIVSHDQYFIDEIGINQTINLN